MSVPPRPTAPLVSVITVVRNDAGGLARTIESVRRQSYRPIEYVVVDGAASDGTVEMIRANADCIDSWISEPDRGIAEALNKGSRMAAGDLFLFLNAGDRFVDEHALERAVDHIPQGVDVRGAIFYGDARY